MPRDGGPMGRVGVRRPGDIPSFDEGTKRTALAGGSVVGALAMSSCCIAPLVLFSLGVTGAWIGNLAALYPYKWFFFLVTALFLAGGFWRVYRGPSEDSCESGGSCASPMSHRINKAVLWAATVMVLAAVLFPYIAPSFLDS